MIKGYLYNKMEPDLYVVLPKPPSVNAIYANVPNVGRVKTKAYRKWEEDALASLWPQRLTYFETKVAVVYSFEVPDNRKRDCANLEKALSDFLVKTRIILDDSHIRFNAQEWLDCEEKGDKAHIKIYNLE